jgi:DNA-binding PadR family transcriptional regulator
MPVRKLRGALSLIVLGLLAEEPVHPYAMRQRITERAHDRLPGVRLASLYDVVGRLAGAGFIRPGEPGRAGHRPERVEYTLTDAGREALTSWVTEALADPARGEEFPAALSFMFALGPGRVIELLRARSAALGASADADEAALAAAEAGGTGPVFLSEHRYQIAIRRAEQAWLDTFTSQLQAGTLGWPAAPGKD